MMLNVLLSIFIWFKLSLNKFLMCKKFCLLIMPNRTYKLMASKLGVEHTPRTHSILRGIRRGSSKILKYKKKTRLLPLRRKRRRRNTRRLTIPMILSQVKSQLLILTAYLLPMLKQKTTPSLKKRARRRMIHPKYEKKKHPINARSTLEKTSSQEDMGRKENHGYRNPCPFQVSPSNLKKKIIIINFVNG